MSILHSAYWSSGDLRNYLSDLPLRILHKNHLLFTVSPAFLLRMVLFFTPVLQYRNLFRFCRKTECSICIPGCCLKSVCICCNFCFQTTLYDCSLFSAILLQVLQGHFLQLYMPCRTLHNLLMLLYRYIFQTCNIIFTHLRCCSIFFRDCSTIKCNRLSICQNSFI